ncbi:helix-turn-helix domain-containing protein [Aerococcaceae bacterium DSM 109653]|uniref:Helix-turn-helix domain-containing protein n=1 Tax=Fundicoccus ignavus TaxID=2664442 RepID=A0A844BT75_9LACT|nr:helix-turn-helix transcriptional regulator [Fundicoccus ignavus]MRI80719.1 helix-turn-helix domain-containing protein [Fundicoccus ignavus]
MENNFRVILAVKRLKISDVIEATGISRTTLTNLFYERLKNPNYATLQSVADFLDVSIDELVNKDFRMLKTEVR